MNEAASAGQQPIEPIRPSHVRYIKLGAGGRWEQVAYAPANACS